MDLDELRTLGETATARSHSFDYVICRHGKTIGERGRESTFLGPCTGPLLKARKCAQCIVEMEILERLERIELFLLRWKLETQ